MTRQIDGRHVRPPLRPLDRVGSLAERRGQLGLDVGEVAAAVGVEVATYEAWESGRATPPEGVRLALAYALDAGTRVIERWCGEPGPDDPYRIGRPR